MLRSYLPVLVFGGLGAIVGAALVAINGILGPKQRQARAQADPYECGLPSEVSRTFRFGISFYLIAMLFILFDIALELLTLEVAAQQITRPQLADPQLLGSARLLERSQGPDLAPLYLQSSAPRRQT